MLAQEPRLLAGQVLRAEVTDALGWSVGDTHPHRGEAGGEPAPSTRLGTGLVRAAS